MSCTCGRSPTGKCVGWHNLSEEDYQNKKIAWESKKASSSSVTNYKINQIYDSAISDGALAGKLSGAGGGGFMMFFVPPEKRLKIIEGLKIFEGQYYEFHFSNYGCQSWRV